MDENLSKTHKIVIASSLLFLESVAGSTMGPVHVGGWIGGKDPRTYDSSNPLYVMAEEEFEDFDILWHEFVSPLEFFNFLKYCRRVLNPSSDPEDDQSSDINWTTDEEDGDDDGDDGDGLPVCVHCREAHKEAVEELAHKLKEAFGKTPVNETMSSSAQSASNSAVKNQKSGKSLGPQCAVSDQHEGKVNKTKTGTREDSQQPPCSQTSVDGKPSSKTRSDVTSVTAPKKSVVSDRPPGEPVLETSAHPQTSSETKKSDGACRKNSASQESSVVSDQPLDNVNKTKTETPTKDSEKVLASSMKNATSDLSASSKSKVMATRTDRGESEFQASADRQLVCSKAPTDRNKPSSSATVSRATGHKDKILKKKSLHSCAGCSQVELKLHTFKKCQL